MVKIGGLPSQMVEQMAQDREDEIKRKAIAERRMPWRDLHIALKAWIIINVFLSPLALLIGYFLISGYFQDCAYEKNRSQQWAVFWAVTAGLLGWIAYFIYIKLVGKRV